MFLTLIQDKIYLITAFITVVFTTLLPIELLMSAIVLWSDWFDADNNDLVWQIWNKT